MLVIVSDLHLGDGTLASTIAPDAFDRFATYLEQLAYRASWRADGRYHPLSQVDVVLLGDILELLNSAVWNDSTIGGEAYPWSDPDDPAMQAKVQAIVEGVLQHNAAGLAVLRELAAGRRLSLPPAVQGRPDPDAREYFPLEVRFHYVVGNHDWYLHLPGEAYDAIRRTIVQQMGLAPPPTPFPAHIHESETLQAIFATHEVFARHGDYFDPINYPPVENGRDNPDVRNAASLGDAIGTLLFNRFPLEVAHRLPDLPPAFHRDLRELINVRPVMVTPLWISSLMHRHNLSIAVSNQVKAVWDELATAAMDDPFVRSFDRFGWDVVDLLQMVLFFTTMIEFPTIEHLMQAVYQHFGKEEKISYADHAIEDGERFPQARFIVYGHTHFPEMISLNLRDMGGQFVPQMYVNSGTWHTYHELAIASTQPRRFLSYRVMTILAFFRGDEHGGERLEAWNGIIA